MAKKRSQAAELKMLERQSVMFEWYVTHAWNYHRKLVKKHLSPRCNVCAISSRVSSLCAGGVCQLCQDHRTAHSSSGQNPANLTAMRQLLDQDLTNAQGSGAQNYDVLLLFSGGKDSIFLVHELKRRYPKLRILAYLVDSGLMGPRSLINAQKATDKLDVDYIHFKPDVRFCRALYREAALFEKPGYGCKHTGDFLEFYSILALASNYAQQVGIPYVVDGLNWAQVALTVGAEYKTPSEKMVGYFARDAEMILSPQLRQEYSNYFQTPAHGQAPHFLHPFFVWRSTEMEIRKLVIDSGYVEKGSDSPILTNNRFVSAMFFIDYARLGYGSYEDDICSQVRLGTADRVYWRNIFEMAEYSAKTGWLIKPVIEPFQQELGLIGNPFKLSWLKE